VIKKFVIYQVVTEEGTTYFVDREGLSQEEINNQLEKMGFSSVIDNDWEETVLAESNARTGWKDLGDWSTWTPQQAQDYVNAEILNGWDQAQIDSYIDANITGTNVTQLRTQTVAALKLLSGNLITLRNIVGVIAKVILYIRDILIKRL